MRKPEHEPLETSLDARLRRKIAALRVLFSVLETAVIVLVLAMASRGEMLARSSLSGARADSRASLVALSWADSPILFVLNALWLLLIMSLFVFGAYLAAVRLTKRFHGRPWFRRKYPY